MRVITSITDKWQKDSLRILQKGKNIYKKNWVLIAALTFGLAIPTIGILAPLGALIGWKRDKVVGKNPLQVKILEGGSRLHAKMYIVDGTFVATGSLNYTSSGFWKNVEHIDYHEGEEAQSIMNQFNSIWSSSSEIQPHLLSIWDLKYLGFKIGNALSKIRTARSRHSRSLNR